MPTRQQKVLLSISKSTRSAESRLWRRRHDHNRSSGDFDAESWQRETMAECYAFFMSHVTLKRITGVKNEATWKAINHIAFLLPNEIVHTFSTLTTTHYQNPLSNLTKRKRDSQKDIRVDCTTSVASSAAELTSKTSKVTSKNSRMAKYYPRVSCRQNAQQRTNHVTVPWGL